MTRLTEELTAIATARTQSVANEIIQSDFKQQKLHELKKKWLVKKMYGQFIREIPEKVDREKTWNWFGKGDLKIQTEALLCAAQEQAIRTNYIKHRVDKSSDYPLCRMCGKRGATVHHIVSE